VLEGGRGGGGEDVRNSLEVHPFPLSPFGVLFLSASDRKKDPPPDVARKKIDLLRRFQIIGHLVLLNLPTWSKLPTRPTKKPEPEYTRTRLPLRCDPFRPFAPRTFTVSRLPPCMQGKSCPKVFS
jgi:hypothetical protein